MRRNNEDRVGPRRGGDESPSVSAESVLQFVTPTEFVELPSKGQGYSLGHPLNGQETIEIRYMTAKDEDILSSRSLLRSGVALDRLISNVIVNKNINSSELLVGDRNAILIAARSSAYGHVYKTKVTCPSCLEVVKKGFDLTDPKRYDGEDYGDYDVEKLDNGNYIVVLPRTKFKIEVKLLTGKEEQSMIKQLSKKKNKNETDSLISQQMRLMIVSVEGHAGKGTIDYFIDNIPALEARYLRDAYNSITPDIKVSGNFECPSCGYEQELEVPLGADFFWPDR